MDLLIDDDDDDDDGEGVARGDGRLLLLRPLEYDDDDDDDDEYEDVDGDGAGVGEAGVASCRGADAVVRREDEALRRPLPLLLPRLRPEDDPKPSFIHPSPSSSFLVLLSLAVPTDPVAAAPVLELYEDEDEPYDEEPRDES